MNFIHKAEIEKESSKQDDPLTRGIIGAAIEVHRRLGPGLLESTYETCLCYELNFIGLKVECQIPIPIFYRDVKLDSGYRIDMVVQGEVILEIKSVASLLPVHEARLISYLRQFDDKKIALPDHFIISLFSIYY